MTQTMLVIGPVSQWQRAQRELPLLEGIDFVEFSELSAEYLERTNPDFVLSALVGDGFDALDIARRLQELGFRGRYRAVAQRLASPEVVWAEVAAVAPEIDFDVFEIEPPRSGAGGARDGTGRP